MDLTKSHESDTDTETPLLQTHLTKALSLSTNGSLNPGYHHQYHNHHHYQPQPPPQPTTPQHNILTSYKECLKNHAASLGGLALDGCGEFMPASNATHLVPSSLKCAACGCHRNFHRREQLNYVTTASSPSQSPTSPASSPTPQQSIFPSASQVLLALSTGLSGPLDEANQHQRGVFSPTVMNPVGKKRARTKFSEEQKEKMFAFAEKLGWKMVRGSSHNDDRMVDEFCNEVGVKRSVFKVWMHNNKSRKEKGQSCNNNNNSAACSDDDVKEGIVSGFGSSNNYNTFDRFRIESKVCVPACTEDFGSSPNSSS